MVCSKRLLHSENSQAVGFPEILGSPSLEDAHKNPEKCGMASVSDLFEQELGQEASLDVPFNPNAPCRPSRLKSPCNKWSCSTLEARLQATRHLKTDSVKGEGLLQPLFPQKRSFHTASEAQGAASCP